MPIAKPADPPATEDEASARVLTILAVDDDPLVLMSTGAMLEELGHTVIEANSGAEALAVLRGGAKIDMLFTDQSMPEMTGVQLAQSAQSEWPGLPVVLATGYSDLPPGSPRFPMIGKPFNESDLARAIENALSQA